MEKLNTEFEIACRQRLDQFFATYHDIPLQESAAKALRFLLADEKPLAGKPEGWAAGIVYAAANRHRIPCGIPGLLNSEFKEFFGVSMETIRARAATVLDRTSI